MSTDNILKIEDQVPFAPAVYCWLEVDQVDLDDLVTHSRIFEPHYLAWETVRRRRNPFFDRGTGFEGYFVGTYYSSEEVLERIIGFSREMLTHIAREYRFEYGFRTRLMKTLTGELADPKAIRIWSAQLGATVAKLHGNIHRNHDADVFHSETYQIVDDLPEIKYWEDDYLVEQLYEIGPSNLNGARRISVNIRSLKPSYQDAWLVALSIGRFGHPLLRQILREPVTWQNYMWAA